MKSKSNSFYCFFLTMLIGMNISANAQNKKPKAVFIIVDGIPGDVIEKLKPPTLTEIAAEGGFTLARVGGDKGSYNQTPTISAVGYNSLITGTWVNKHNVWDNDIAAPNYSYWNIFRIAEKYNPDLKTAIFSTWLDNRTKLIGEGLDAAGAIKLDYSYDGLELDTTKYPHDNASWYIHQIDEAVTDEAHRYIETNGPDLSWVYLEYTDDMGHRYGDSQKFYDGILMADKQIKKVWDAIKVREKKFAEDWLIVITTDHGRDATTGKGHGGQSDRERLTWITTNSKKLNSHFSDRPEIVDIMPSICNHLQLPLPDAVGQEIDGVPFIGTVDITNLTVERTGNNVVLHWKNINSTSQNLEIYLASTNQFKKGGSDEYQKIGTVAAQQQEFIFTLQGSSEFYKVVVKTPHHYLNAWITVQK